MIQEIFKSSEGITIYPIIGLIIFFSLFIVIVIRVIRMKKEQINKASNLPFEDEKTNGKINHL